MIDAYLNYHLSLDIHMIINIYIYKWRIYIYIQIGSFMYISSYSHPKKNWCFFPKLKSPWFFYRFTLRTRCSSCWSSPSQRRARPWRRGRQRCVHCAMPCWRPRGRRFGGASVRWGVRSLKHMFYPHSSSICMYIYCLYIYILIMCYLTWFGNIICYRI